MTNLGRQVEAFRVNRPDGATLSGSVVGQGRDVLLLHGLTASRRYVLMGSRILEKNGFRVISYDARGHGTSSAPTDSTHYTYPRLVSDAIAVLEQVGAKRPLVIGVSMGAHTAAVLASDRATDVSGSLLITPAYNPEMSFGAEAAQHWDGLSDALRSGGAEGFVEATDFGSLDDRWTTTARKATLQRMLQHRHPEAVADALRQIPRSRPFEAWSTLSEIDQPTSVVGSRDSADPGHPLAVAAAWADVIPSASLVVEDEGDSPIAWRGATISKLIQELV